MQLHSRFMSRYDFSLLISVNMRRGIRANSIIHTAQSVKMVSINVIISIISFCGASLSSGWIKKSLYDLNRTRFLWLCIDICHWNFIDFFNYFTKILSNLMSSATRFDYISKIIAMDVYWMIWWDEKSSEKYPQ